MRRSGPPQSKPWIRPSGDIESTFHDEAQEEDICHKSSYTTTSGTALNPLPTRRLDPNTQVTQEESRKDLQRMIDIQ